MASKYDNRAGADTIPPPRRVNSLQSIMKLRPISGAEWSTIAFVLNRDMIKPDGSLDELHAVVFPLGSFHDQEKAEEHARNVIAITGHPGVIAARYGSPFPLTTKFNPDNVVEVTVDTKGRLVELESAQYKRDKEEYEKRVKIERDIMKEAEEEDDPNSIEHFKRQCYLAIKNRSSYQVHTREADNAWQNYKKREMAVRDHYARHPEHEAEWLQYLKEKLTERGELDLYHGIEVAYAELRDELLGLVDSSDEEDNTVPEPSFIAVDSNNGSLLNEETECLINDGIACERRSGICPEYNDKLTVPSCITLTTSEESITVSEELLPVTTSEESPSDDCEGGICVAIRDVVDDIIPILDPRHINSVTESANIDDVGEDDIIAVEDIPAETVECVSISTDPDPGFIDENEVVLSSPSPKTSRPQIIQTNTLTNRTKKNKKRGKRN